MEQCKRKIAKPIGENMKFARYQVNGSIAYGLVEGDEIRQITTTPFQKYQITDKHHSISDINILAPTIPNKIIAIGLNYKSHLKGSPIGDREAPKVPEPFFKTTSSVIGPNGTIVIPKDATNVQEEAELAVVIGKKCKGATKANALQYILGYTCGNDISARDWQREDLQWWRAKSSDTFAPIGPYIVTDIDPSDLQLMARINGKVVQESSTSNLIHNIPTILEFISRVITLEPGDIIMTGTPGQPKNLEHGDKVEVEIEGIGILENSVVSE